MTGFLTGALKSILRSTFDLQVVVVIFPVFSISMNFKLDGSKTTNNKQLHIVCICPDVQFI